MTWLPQPRRRGSRSELHCAHSALPGRRRSRGAGGGTSGRAEGRRPRVGLPQLPPPRLLLESSSAPLGRVSMGGGSVGRTQGRPKVALCCPLAPGRSASLGGGRAARSRMPRGAGRFQRLQLWAGGAGKGARCSWVSVDWQQLARQLEEGLSPTSTQKVTFCMQGWHRLQEAGLQVQGENIKKTLPKCIGSR